MYRKLGTYLLAALLVLLPVSAAIGGKANAASSSRIAVIKQLSGDVQVQKAGGSKQFKAFAKLSLNQGDKLITGSKGSAVLQFANGTSEDDKFTVGENATLTFSKLSDKKGTVTKVSMLKGTAWVDVKSIKSKDDDFKLETPTAIMGVRGTAFFARVNPLTGGTNTAVMSGVVRLTSDNIEKTGSASGESTGGTGSSGAKTIDLYPTQQITLEPTSGSDPGELTTLVDIAEIVKNASPEVIEAMLRSKEKIDEENRQTVEKFKQSGVPAELQQSLDKFAQNIEELLGVIAKQAIEQKKITEQQVKKIEEQEKTSFDLDKDRLSQLGEKEKAKQEKAKLLAEEAAKRKAAEEAAKLKELADKINAAALKAIEAAKQAQDEANRLAAEVAKRKAEEELLKKLNEQQKQQYQTDKTNNQGGTTVTPGTNTGNLSSNANLGSLSLDGATLSPSFNAAVAEYRASVASDKTSIVVGASVQDSGASFTINGQVPSGGQRTVSLAYGDNVITVLVTAQNGATNSYKLTVTRQLLNNVSVVFPGQNGIDIDFNSTSAPAPLSIPSGSSNLTLVVPVTGPELDIAVNGQNVEPEPMFMAARTILPDQISWRYIIPLVQASNEIEIKATIDGVVKSYKLLANRSMPSDAAVQSVSAKSADGTASYEVSASGGNAWTVKVPADVTTIKLRINAINEAAKILLGTNEYASGAEIPYTIINTTVQFKVRAADGTVPELFNSISIARLPSSDATLSDLTLSNGTLLSPAFTRATTSYTASVGHAVDSITVSPTASNGNATILVNDGMTTSGKPSKPISLSVGTNQITVEVTAQNGARQKYTIIVTRETTALAAPTFNPSSGEVALGTQIEISSEAAEHIYYTMDGSDPATSAGGATKEYTKDSKPTIEAAVTIKAIATRAGSQRSPISSATYTQAASADLTGLALSGSPTGFSFSGATYIYDGVRVASGVASVTVQPSGAGSILVNGVPVVSGQSSGPILLAEGEKKTITVTVGETGKSVKTYTINVTRDIAPPSADASLSELTLSGTTLTPSFDSGKYAYTATVGGDTSTIAVTVTASHSGAAIEVNGTAVEGSSVTQAIALTYGTNPITIQVTAQDGSTVATYVVTVTREPGAALSAPAFDPPAGPIAFGTAITLSSSGAEGILYTLDGSDPAVSPTRQLYSSAAPPTIESAVTIKAVAVKTGSLDSPVATATYTQAATADLTGLSLSGDPTNYMFQGDKYVYDEVTVGYEVGSVTVTPSGAGAVTIDGHSASMNLPSTAILLQAGVERTIEISVIESGKLAKTYTIKIKRDVPPLSQNADLSDLAIAGATLEPSFSSAVTSYTASVGYGVSSVTVTPVTADSKATVTVNGQVVQSGQASGSVFLNVGINPISIIVTSESGMTKQYTINVDRAPAPLTAPIFTPASGVVSYGAQLTIESPGAERIYYTTDGTDPDTQVKGSTKLYDAEAKPTINASMTVKAIAVATGLANSAIATADYIVEESAGLSELYFSEDVENFAFSPETFDYPEVTVQGSVDRMKVYPSGAGTITVNGQAVASGSASQNIMLASGGKTDIVIVIAETGKAPKTYAIKVDRPVYTGEMPWQLLDWTVKTDQGDWLTWSTGSETEVMFYGAIVPEEASSLSMTLNFNTDAYDEIKFYLTNDDLEGQEILFQSGIEGTLPLSNVDKTTRYEMSFYKNGNPVGQWVLLKVGKGMPDLSPIMTGLQLRDENDFFAVTPTGPNGEYGLYVSPGTTELYLVPDWENRVTIHDVNDNPFEDESIIPISSDLTALTVWVSNGMAETSYKLHVYRTGLTASLKLQDLEANGQKLSYNPLAKSYTFTAPMDAATASIEPITSAGGEIDRVIYKGTELTPANGLYTIAVPEEGEAIVGIVVSAGGEQYAHRLVVRRLPPIEGLNGWSLHAGSNAEGPAIGIGFDDYYADGYGQVFASVDTDVQTVTAIFNLDEGASISAYDQSDERSPDLVVDSRATLALSEGLNSFRFELTDNEGYSHSFDLDVIRGPMPLVDMDVMDAAGEYLSYEKTGPQSYHVTTNSSSISLHPHLRGYFDEAVVWVDGERLEETSSPIPLAPGWNSNIRIVVYEYNGGLVSEYPVAVWQGEGEAPGATVDWRLRGAVSLEEDPIYADNKVAVLSPDNQQAMIMPELIGDDEATIERVYVNGKEIGQAEGIGTYGIDLNVAAGLYSNSTYVTLILKDAEGRLIPRTLEIVSGIYAENGQATTNEGESKGLSLVARTGSDVETTPNWEIVAEPAHGTLMHVEGPYYIYEPAPGYAGGDSFTYRASYSWNDGEAEHTLFSNEATVSIKVDTQEKIALSGSGLVDGNASAGNYVGQLSAMGEFNGPISYALSEGEGDDQNSLFSIDSDGRLFVNSDLGADDPESMSIRVKASDGSGHSIEQPLSLFYAINLEVLMNSSNGGGETGIVAGLLPGGDYWADGIMSNEQLTERENFRLAISGPDNSWAISSEGNSFEYAGGRYYLGVDKPAAGSSHDYPIVMTDGQGHSFSFTFHYYQGPIAEQLDSQSGDSGLRQSLSDGNQSYQTNIDVSEVLGWYATVLDDSEQLLLNAMLEPGVALRVFDQFGREAGAEDNMSGEGALEASIDLLAYGAQERYYVYATFGGNTIVYPLRVSYEAAPALTSLSLWYTAGSGGIPIDLTSYEMSVEIPSNKLIPSTPPYLPLGIDALAMPGQIVRVYRWNGEDWTEMELAPATNHDGETKNVYSFDYQEPYQEYKITVSTLGGQSVTYLLALMQPGFEGSA